MENELILCPECGFHYNPKYLDQVAEHMHAGVVVDRTIKGERVRITVKELRIGNCVQYNKRPFVIDTLSSEEPFLGSEVDYYKIQPIPLTTEILEKCGFEKDATLDHKWGEHYVLDMPVIGENKNEIYFYFAGELNFGRASVNRYHASNNIYYVHQLQNLYFALTGEELEIKL